MLIVYMADPSVHIVTTQSGVRFHTAFFFVLPRWASTTHLHVDCDLSLGVAQGGLYSCTHPIAKSCAVHNIALGDSFPPSLWRGDGHSQHSQSAFLFHIYECLRTNFEARFHLNLPIHQETSSSPTIPPSRTSKCSTKCRQMTKLGRLTFDALSKSCDHKAKAYETDTH